MASLNELFKKIKGFWLAEEVKREKILTVAIIFLVGAASFGLGRLSSFESQKEPVSIKTNDFTADLTETIQIQEENKVIDIKAGGMVVASKNSDKYHFPWCSGARRIKEENKIYFNSIEEARKAGYLPAGNCKGLE